MNSLENSRHGRRATSRCARTRRTFHTEDACAIEYNYATIGGMIDVAVSATADPDN